MREIYLYQAIQEAVSEEMRRDERVFLTGEAVGPSGTSPTRPPKEIMEEFGEHRVRETGIVEQMLAAGSAGAAMAGMRPIVDFMMADFMFPAWNEIMQAGLWRSGHGGAENISIPVVYMSGLMSYGSGGFSHSRAPIANVWHGPGLKVVLPTTPYDTKGLLKTAIRDNNPVVFISHRLLYRTQGPVPEEEYLIPFGEATVRREGKDVTIVALSYMVNLSLEAAEVLEQEGISVEIIDPRTLEPLDINTILVSVEKTGRLVVVDEDYIRCGIGAEIAFQVQEKLLKSLKAPVQRVGNLNTPIPVASNLMQAVMPTKEKIIAAVKKTLV
ncbi:MAG: transketolase C-terminal domain-containing protein [Dehalococcoidales bacterium]|nr:transketolase C-terminal domain-containing protein [Dehalococcoidales bacterium]